MEIFDHWWEYFRVLYWSLSPPAVEYFITEPVSFALLEKEYKEEIEKIKQEGEGKVKFILDLMDKGVSSEEERRTVIETKAHSMISQSGLAIPLLVAALSLISISINDLIAKSIILFLLCAATIHFIAAVLHARHIVSLKYFYPRQDFASYLTHEDRTVDYILSQVLIIRRLSELNSVKATFLKFSHWFYKATFSILLLMTFCVPTLLYSIGMMDKNLTKVVIINSTIAQKLCAGERQSCPNDTTSCKRPAICKHSPRGRKHHTIKKQ